MVWLALQLQKQPIVVGTGYRPETSVEKVNLLWRLAGGFDFYGYGSSFAFYLYNKRHWFTGERETISVVAVGGTQAIASGPPVNIV